MPKRLRQNLETQAVVQFTCLGSGIKLSIVMLSVVILRVIMLCVGLLCVVMLSVFI
jgi:hypothetical protein